MRIIIFYAGGDLGGGKTHIMNLASELSKHDDIRLVCFRVGELSKEAAQAGIDTAVIDTKKGFAAAKRFAKEQVLDFKADLIHCHGSKANLLGVITSKATGIPVMTTVHSDPELDYMGAPLRNITYGNINRWALKRMDYYTAVGSTMRDLLISRGVDPYKISPIFNSMAFDENSAWKEEGELIRVGIAARLNPVKDIKTLVRAFAQAYTENNRLRLSIAGIGEEEEMLKEMVKQLGISEVTTFEGWVNDMKAYFSQIDINVLCSLSETFPYSILEGATMHVPVIATAVGAIPSLIHHKDTGLIFKPKDADTLAKDILLLAGDASLRKKLGDNLFEKAKSEFSLDRMRMDQEAIYERVIDRQKIEGRQGVVLCGAYGKGNAGDEAILRAILRSLRAIDEDMPIQVMSRKPMETKLNNHVSSFFIFNIFKFKKALKESKLFISGGGTLIQDITSTRSLWFYLYSLKQAKKYGCKIEMYGCGVGPVNKGKNRQRASKILNETADIITLRDSMSVEFLKENHVTKPEVILTADPTVNLELPDEDMIQESLSKIGLSDGQKYVVFCLRPWDGFQNLQAIKEAAEFIYNRYGFISVFLPMEYPRDVAIGLELCQKIKTPCLASDNHHSIDELRSILMESELVIGMRLHSLVFAASSGTPIVGLSYDVKVESFVKDAGTKRLVSVEELTKENLIENVDLALADGKAMGEETKRHLQLLEKMNSEAAARLLG